MAKFDSYPDNSAPADADLLISTDVSDTSADASGTTKKLTVSTLLNSGLDATVGALDATTGDFSGDVTVSSDSPDLVIDDTNGTVDQRRWRLSGQGAQLLVQSLNDAGTTLFNHLQLFGSGRTIVGNGTTVEMENATRVSVPTPSSAGHALAFGDDATVAALTAGGITKLSSALPDLRFDESDQASGSKVTRMFSQGGIWFLTVAADNGSTTQEVLRVDRTGVVTFNAPSVSVPTPSSAGHALAFGDDATVGALDATTGDFTGDVTVQGTVANLVLDDTDAGVDDKKFRIQSNSGTLALQALADAGTFKSNMVLLTDSSVTVSQPLTVPTPTAVNHAVKVVAWDATTGRYAVQGPNGVVEQGDTGWRRIATWSAGGALTAGTLDADYRDASANPGWINVRRQGNTVSVRVSQMKVAVTGTTENLLGGATEASWYPTGLDSAATFVGGSFDGLNLYSDGSTILRRGGGGVWTGTAYNGVFSYPVEGAWPTSLPGTAV